MPTVDPVQDATATPEVQIPTRFTRVGATWIDLAAVVAVGVEHDGFTLHLSGGQAMALPAASAETAGVLKRLGLPKGKWQPKGKRRKAKGKRQKVKQPVAAAVLAAIAGFFSG